LMPTGSKMSVWILMNRKVRNALADPKQYKNSLGISP
jgi:hypothetical protein